MAGFQRAFCISANVLLAFGILVFAGGFFPHKPFLTGLASWHEVQEESLKEPPFDKVIFMVVDALRSDFLYSSQSQFTFTQSLIRSGAAVPFDGHASPPTITMPRIKAITTGSVPSFLDVVLNFAESDTTSTLANQDSWLAQMRRKKTGKLLMYGDDTWLKLFPGFFDRADGTTSFFVSDFTEVDRNVSRHVPGELGRDDWSVMVLHFLGLDHIGHKSGPKSVHMAPKQKEMDEMVQTIYHALEHEPHLKSTLLVLCGDHGMNDAGNHGGSSPGEVTAALTFISPVFKSVFEGFESPIASSSGYSFYEKVEQSDIAPTLASLLGFPIPLNNLGIIIPKLLALWPQETDKLNLLKANALQMADIAKATYPESFQELESGRGCAQSSSESSILSCAWKEAVNAMQDVENHKTTADSATAVVSKFLRTSQSQLSGTASNYKLIKMFAGILIVGLSTVLAAVSLQNGTMSLLTYGPRVIVIVGYSVSMFASSYVEEEHQFWYWALGGWLTYLAVKEQRLPSRSRLPIPVSVFPLVLITFGIIRNLNSSGQKYAALPSISSTLFPREQWVLWLLTTITYAVISRRLTRRASTWGEDGSKQLSFLPIPVCIAAFCFKVAFTHAHSPELLQDFPPLDPLVALTSRYSLVGQARVVYLGIAHMFFCALYYETPWSPPGGMFIDTFHNLLHLVLLTQTRASNIPIFLLSTIQLFILTSNTDLFDDTAEISLTSLLLSYASFFALGGTNAISSIDLSNAYNGVSGYNVVLVGILTFVGNWAGPIWWSSGTVLLFVHKARQVGSASQNQDSHGKAAAASNNQDVGIGHQPSISRIVEPSYFSHFSLMTVFATASTFSVMLACTALREHLFIWTVFSPKYLYVGAWMLGHHLLINGVFAWGILGNLYSQ